MKIASKNEDNKQFIVIPYEQIFFLRPILT